MPNQPDYPLTQVQIEVRPACAAFLHGQEGVRIWKTRLGLRLAFTIGGTEAEARKGLYLAMRNKYCGDWDFTVEPAPAPAPQDERCAWCRVRGRYGH